MIKENRPQLRSALSDLISAATQADAILLGSERNDAYRTAHGQGNDSTLDAAVMADIDTAKSAIVTAYNAASAIFTATEPV
jgi:hypothetical protein